MTAGKSAHDTKRHRLIFHKHEEDKKLRQILKKKIYIYTGYALLVINPSLENILCIITI